MKNIILLLFTFLSFSTFSQEKDAGYYHSIAVDSLWNSTTYEERDWRLIIEYLNKAIQLDSTQVKYFRNRAYAHKYNRQDSDLALRDFRKVLILDSTSNKFSSVAHYERAILFRGNK